jgi:hypothetical protein
VTTLRHNTTMRETIIQNRGYDKHISGDELSLKIASSTHHDYPRAHNR